MSKWNVSQPGGPAGPFYGIVSSTGEVIVLQAGCKEWAEFIAQFGDILDYNLEVIHEAGRHLKDIIKRDGAETAVSPGAEDYVVRAVIEALFTK